MRRQFKTLVSVRLNGKRKHTLERLRNKKLELLRQDIKNKRGGQAL